MRLSELEKVMQLNRDIYNLKRQLRYCELKNRKLRQENQELENLVPKAEMLLRKINKRKENAEMRLRRIYKRTEKTEMLLREIKRKEKVEK